MELRDTLSLPIQASRQGRNKAFAQLLGSWSWTRGPG